MRELHASPGGRVTVGLPPRVALGLGAPLVQRFRARFPRAAITVSEGLSLQLREWLIAGRLDLALLFDPPASPQLAYRTLMREPLLLVAPAEGVELPSRVGLAALAAYPLVLPRAPNAIRSLVDAVLRPRDRWRAGRRPQSTRGDRFERHQRRMQRTDVSGFSRELVATAMLQASCPVFCASWPSRSPRSASQRRKPAPSTPQAAIERSMRCRRKKLPRRPCGGPMGRPKGTSALPFGWNWKRNGGMPRSPASAAAPIHPCRRSAWRNRRSASSGSGCLHRSRRLRGQPARWCR